MARRERTTALPRPHPRAREASGRSLFGFRWDDRGQRMAILGGVLALLVFVVGWFAWRVYDDNFRIPNSTVLTVGGDTFSLRYYTERLSKFLKDVASQQQSAAPNVGIIEQQLMSKLEDEALTVQLAKANGITISNDDINAAIGTDIGVGSGGTSPLFDQLYRQKLKTNKLSDATYRQLTTAFVANEKLVNMYAGQVADTGELVTIRAVVTATKDDADSVASQISGSQDMGTLAQNVSLDDSRTTDGLMPAVPTALLPQAVQDAISGKSAGPTLLGPVQVANAYWVFRIETRDPSATITSDMKQQLGQKKLDDSLTDLRQKTKIVRSLSTSDVKWAEAHAQ